MTKTAVQTHVEEPWHFPRAALAKSIVERLRQGFTQRVALFAKRRMGKSQFMLRDLLPDIEAAGLMPVYMSMWENRNAPHVAIQGALQDALDKWDQTNRRFTTSLKSVKKAGAQLQVGGNGIGFDFERISPKQASADQIKAIGDALAALMERAPGVVLLVDEAQHLATHDDFLALTSALRTYLDTNAGRLFAVFTGSSRTDMSALIDSADAPLYGSFEQLPFPALDIHFISDLCRMIKERSGDRVDQAAFWRIFESDFRLCPELAIAVARKVIFDRMPYQVAVQSLLEQVASRPNLDSLWLGLGLMDRGVLLYLAVGPDVGPYTKKGLAWLVENFEGLSRAPQTRTVQNSVRKLSRQNLIHKQRGRGRWRIDDVMLEIYVDFNFRNDRFPATDDLE